MKEQRFEKIVEWKWLGNSGQSFLLGLFFWIFGFVSGYKKFWSIFIIITIAIILCLFSLNGFPKRKVYWRKLR